MDGMHPRVRLALMVTGTIALAAIVATLLALRSASGDGGGAGAGGWAGAVRPAIPPDDFTLRDQDGRTVSLHDSRGQVTVLTFLYSTCQDTCPVTASTIRGALDDLGHDVPTLAVSVDPAGDTPQHARSFLLRRGVNGRMRFLLGTRAELAPVWKAYGIAPQRPGTPASDPAFAHSAYILLIDRQGRQRIGFPVAEATPEGIAHDIRRLEAEGRPQPSASS